MATQTQAGSTEQRVRAHVTPHTVKVRRQQAIAKGVIWAAAGVAMAILVLIVGYIIFNGFYTRSVQDYPVTPYQELIVPVSEEREMVLLATRSLRLDNLPFSTLVEIFTGQQPYLGYLTGQNRRATTAILDDNGFPDAVETYLLPDGGTLADLGTPPQVVSSPREIESLLRSEDGTLALVPAAAAEQIDAGRRVGIRQASVVVNEDVLALQAGRRLTYLTEADVQALLTGEIAAWADVGGPSIEVVPADLANDDPGEYRPLPPVPVVAADPEAPWAYADDALEVEDGSLAETVVRVDSLEEFTRTIRNTPGAVGITRAREAASQGLATVPVEFVRHELNLRPSLFVTPPSRAGAVGGLSTIIVNTLVMVAFVLLIAGPLGIAAAVYLVEYAKKGPLLNVLRLGTDTLAGIPSIIFGLFGLVFFAQILGFQTGLLSGTLTLTLMILPTIVRTSEEALKSVPDDLRAGSLALGATKLQTIFRVVLPAASPGILTGIILGIGRAVGETAAILYTLGSNLALVRSFNSPIRVLTVHLYMLIRENVSLPNAFAAATILVVIVFAVNYTTTKLVGRLNRAAGR